MNVWFVVMDRQLVWKRSLEAICLIYEEMYELVTNGVNQYVDPLSLMNYKPDQMKMLLL
jgi:hypothetical protein